ncbi:hypothetical protein F2Q68_00040228 [Brassica cretica]|uniref:Iron hydrogenase large subunit C-terminal domain-containing protein n=1 Tax=Brassica cretica TaxID=69181 RepID=A0A8S9MH46_BRACR|nr:hypothetical protein F2Q68_00040228 [Brassica cretica]
MSETIPMIFLDWMLPEIALMSVELSEKTLSDENSKDFPCRVVINPKQQFEPVKISLKDCLACRSLLPQQVSDFIEFETYYISKLVMSLRVVTSKLVQKIVNIVRRVKTGKCEYQYVEIMACPAGCLNCVGQSQKALVNSLEATYMNYVVSFLALSCFLYLYTRCFARLCDYETS